MVEVEEQTLCRWSLVGEDKGCFLSAMSKIYSKLNEVGFSDRMGLSRDERIVFNDVVTQLAIQNNEEG